MTEPPHYTTRIGAGLVQRDAAVPTRQLGVDRAALVGLAAANLHTSEETRDVKRLTARLGAGGRPLAGRALLHEPVQIARVRTSNDFAPAKRSEPGVVTGPGSAPGLVEARRAALLRTNIIKRGH